MLAALQIAGFFDVVKKVGPHGSSAPGSFTRALTEAAHVGCTPNRRVFRCRQKGRAAWFISRWFVDPGTDGGGACWLHSKSQGYSMSSKRSGRMVHQQMVR